MRGVLLAALALAASAVTCTNVELQEIPDPPAFTDDLVRVSGELCTRSPESLIFPLRVLFVVDASESMQITDPPDPITGETRRERAVRETWEGLLAQGIQDMRVGVIRFSAEAQSRTTVDLDGDSLTDTYFTADDTLLSIATSALGVTDRTTNYGNALSEAHFELRTEFVRAQLESLPLSRYIVVFLSDGLPDVDPTDDQNNGVGDILGAVEALTELADAFRVGDFSLHTVYLSAGQGPALDQPAQDLLQQMSDDGGGTFRSVPNGERIDFVGIDFSVIRRVFTLRALAAVNLNLVSDTDQRAALPTTPPQRPASIRDAFLAGFVDADGDGALSCGEPLVDSDGDGLSDLVEARIGSDPLNPDTDDDGLRDRLEWDLAQTHSPLDSRDAGCFIPSPCIDDLAGGCACVLDSDFDGVCDCAQDPARGPCADDLGHDCVDVDLDGFCDCPDADRDGFCDYDDRDGDGLGDCEELFYGTAVNGADTDADGIPDLLEARSRTSPTQADERGDFDFDQTDNGAEVLGATDPLCADAALRSRLAYRYSLRDLGLSGDKTCYSFDISNITLAPTLENPRDALGLPRAAPGGPHGDGRNRILVYAGEVAFDDPSTYAGFRVACVEARLRQPGNFKDPPSGKLRVTEEDFVDLDLFDPDRDCHAP